MQFRGAVEKHIDTIKQGGQRSAITRQVTMDQSYTQRQAGTATPTRERPHVMARTQQADCQMFAYIAGSTTKGNLQAHVKRKCSLIF